MILNWLSSIFGSGSYADGAPESTRGKPMDDGNIDRVDSLFPKNVRQQLHWLNVNSTDIPAMVQSATARTIGVSVNVQVESPDAKFNEAAEAFLEEFHRFKVGELTNRHHFSSALRAISDFEMLDGGILVRHHYNTEWTIPYKYELVGVDMIDLGKTEYLPSPDGRATLAGIVLNQWRQIEGIWLFDSDKKRASTLVPISQLTYYSETWVSVAQQVAVSKLASVLPTLDSIDQYTKAELTSAIESAKSGAFLKSSVYNEIMQIAMNAITKASDSEKQKTEIYKILNGLAKTGVKPNGLTPIPLTDDVIFPTQKKEGVYQQLNYTAENKMAASQGMSAISMYAKADQANYSAIKFAAETDQLTASIRFDNISNKVIREIDSRAIAVGIQIGRIPGRKAYWENPEAFHRFSYLRNVYVDIEPAKTANANDTNLKNGLVTKKELVEKRTGRKYEDFLSEKVNYEILEYNMRKEALEKAGINPIEFYNFQEKVSPVLATPIAEAP